MNEIIYCPSGRHLLVDISNVSMSVLNDEAHLVSALVAAAQEEGATVLNTLKHRFTPYGVTILLLLAESHISLHTYPEQGRAFFDAFTCGTRCDPIRIFRAFTTVLQTGCYREMHVERG